MPSKPPEMIPFNRPYMTGYELEFMKQAHGQGHLAGDGPFTRRCHEWLQTYTGTRLALLTQSCTAALEMSALLLNLAPGDEVIMPSFTFVSTANAFALRGALPVFVDIREDTLNLDERLVEAAITPRTRAIVPVHYAGVPCEMDALMAIAAKYNLAVVEDAAQGILAEYKGRALGTIGHLGTYSFHETKNIICGEGGALLVNTSAHMGAAEIIREKGTDRSRFFRGEVDKYTWQAVGSSFLPSELTAAFLWAQLDAAKDLTKRRVALWNTYHELAAPLEAHGLLRRPVVPDTCLHNGHIYYVLLAPGFDRQEVLSALRQQGVNAIFHYVPLHSSPGGLKFSRTHGSLARTDDLAARLVRLPLWIGLTVAQQERVVSVLGGILHRAQASMGK